MTISIPEGLEDEVNHASVEELQDYFSDDNEDQMGDDFQEMSEEAMIHEKQNQILLVENLPKVDAAKAEKLQTFVKKVYDEFGEVLEFSMPMKDDKTLGYAFVLMDSAETATQAREKTDGMNLRKIDFKVSPYSDLDKYGSWSDKFVAPVDKPFQTPANVNAFCEDLAGRDQYVIRQDQNTEIYWCESPQVGAEPTLAYGGEREAKVGKVWCNGYTQWSPNGAYLATFHEQGIALWGGNQFQKIMRFAHSHVHFIEFSPKENYVVTWNGKDNGTDNRSIIVWDILTGRELRSFAAPPGLSWPYLKWSHDDHYVARGIKDGISVFDLQSNPPMKMLQKKPVKTKGMQTYEWSPSDNYIAYWAPEVDNMPARVVLLDPVKRSEVRAKNLFSVSSVQLHWQDSGDFLCAQVLRHTKTKKRTFTNFEIFRMRDNGIPNEMFELKERVEHFSWEPNRERFGVIFGESQHRLDISFYSMGKIKGGEQMKLLHTLVGKRANFLYWSPAGNNVVLAGTSNIQGELEFWDIDEELSTAEEEHFMCNGVYWDPSGRMVATVVTQPMTGPVPVRNTLENGYNLWTFQGALIRKEQAEMFYQFQWRPRPASILTEEQEAGVVKGLKKSMQRFRDADSKRRMIKDAAANAERVGQLTVFRARMQQLHAVYEEEESRRHAQGLTVPDFDKDFEIVEETTEELMKETVEKYNP